METAERIDIHDLILEDEPDGHPLVAPRHKPRPQAKYEVVLSSGTDFAIRRTTSKTERMLVCLVSQGQYYIKDSDGVQPLTVDGMTSFMSQLGPDRDGVELPDCTWTSMVPKGKDRCKLFVSYVSDDRLMTAVRENLVVVDTYESGDGGASNAFDMLDEARQVPEAKAMMRWCLKEEEERYGMTRQEVLRDCAMRQRSGRVSAFVMLKELDEVAGHLGIDAAHQVFSNCLDMHRMATFSPHSFGECWRFEFKSSAFAEYITYGALRQGYLQTSGPMMSYYDSFTCDWRDSLEMQLDLYGEIREKYPKDLKSLHQTLSYLVRERAVVVEQREWDDVLPAMLEREWEDGRYVFLAPRSPADMVDEAAQQSNCLAGYVKRVATGDTQIFFLRKRSHVRESYITIEVTGNGMLGQVFGRFNRRPSDAEYAEVVKWAGEKGLTVPEHRAGMHA